LFIDGPNTVASVRGGGSSGAPLEVLLARDSTKWADWHFLLRFAAEGRLAEFRLVPRSAEPWFFPLDGDGPPITARLLRAVPLGSLEVTARSYLAIVYRQVAPLVERSSSGSMSSAWRDQFEQTSLQRRPGRQGRPDRDYAVLAAAYVAAVKERCPNPVARTAQAMHIAPATARNGLSEARRRGLLETPPVRNRAGGQLTPRALLLLADEGDE
jgi:hypothetical protein